MPNRLNVPVSEQPLVTLRSWVLQETDTGEQHFVGCCIEGQEGRVTSSIGRFEVNTRVGITRTGRSIFPSQTAGTAQALNEQAPPQLRASQPTRETAD